MYEFKIAKWGNSYAVRLPRGMVKTLRLQEGDTVPGELVFNPQFLRDQLEAAQSRAHMSREEAVAVMLDAAKTFPNHLRPEEWKVDRSSPDMRG